MTTPTDQSAPVGTPDLSAVAPELRAGLAFFPDLDFSQGMAPFRQGFAAREVPPLPAELAAIACQERLLPGLPGEPEVRVLHYAAPEPLPGRPALLHLHGGGYVLGMPEINDASNRLWAASLNIDVVSVDYRLAPEATWPSALHDNYAALLWLASEAEALGIDPARIALAGESAGGGHAVSLALHARDTARAHPGALQPCFLLLDAPMLDDRTGSAHQADPHPHCGQLVWTPEKNRFGWTSLLGVEAGGPEVPAGAVPARASDLSGLPPHFISVGALDLFFEEDLEWTRRLARAGVAVDLHVVAGAYHGFGAAQGAPQVKRLATLRHEALARGLGLSLG